MELSEYQRRAQQTFIPSDNELERLVLGLSGEAGEAAETVKKGIRGDDIDVDERLRAELGDTLWYIALIADHLDDGLEDIAEDNLSKLEQRQADNTIQGSGDDR